MLRLPKDVEKHPKRAALEAYFSRSERLLREGGEIKVSSLAFEAKLVVALRAVFGTGHLVQGLEAIELLLDREKKGIQLVLEKTGKAPSQRMSRLVFLANDGAERFVRNAESMLQHHADRAQGCLLDVNAETLGEALTAKGKPAKALMIADRKALGLFLASLGDLL